MLVCFKPSQLTQFYLIFLPFRFDTHILPTWHDESTSIFRDIQQCIFQFFHSYHLRLSLSTYPTRIRAPRRCRRRGRRCLQFHSTLDRWLGRRRNRRMSNIVSIDIPYTRNTVYIKIDIPRRVNDTRLSAQRGDSQRRRGISSIHPHRPCHRLRTGGRRIMRKERVKIKIGVF